MIKPDVRLKLGRTTTVDGPFALVGTAEELLRLSDSLREATGDVGRSGGVPRGDIEVWLGPNPYGSDEIARQLEELAKKVRGDG